MTGPETGDWVARIARELEPLQRSWQRLQRDIEQASKAFAAARDRGDFRSLQLRLRLMGWMAQQLNNAKDNPSHKNARAWLTVGHLTPKQVAQWLPFALMDMPDLRVPKRRGRQKGRTAASTSEMAEQLAKRIADTGELPTTAARRLLAAYGFPGPDFKGRADYLVRVWKNRAFKSR